MSNKQEEDNSEDNNLAAAAGSASNFRSELASPSKLKKKKVLKRKRSIKKKRKISNNKIKGAIDEINDDIQNISEDDDDNEHLAQKLVNQVNGNNFLKLLEENKGNKQMRGLALFK